MGLEPVAHDVEWLEESLAGNAIDELEELAERSGLTLATGENLYGLPALLRYADSRAIATIQPDLAKSGGITVAAALAARAAPTGPRSLRIATAPQWASRPVVGIVGINTGTPNTPEVPFGGFGLAGLGREGGIEGMREFTELQTIAMGR